MRKIYVSIPEDQWHSIKQAPKDGIIVFIRDRIGYVDLAKWSNSEWTTEVGVCDKPIQFSYVTIEDAK